MPSPLNSAFGILSSVLAAAIVLSRKNCATGTSSKTKTFHVGGPEVLHGETTLLEDETQAEKSVATEQPPWEVDPMPQTQPTRPQPIPESTSGACRKMISFFLQCPKQSTIGSNSDKHVKKELMWEIQLSGPALNLDFTRL